MARNPRTNTNCHDEKEMRKPVMWWRDAMIAPTCAKTGLTQAKPTHGSYYTMTVAELEHKNNDGENGDGNE